MPMTGVRGRQPARIKLNGLNQGPLVAFLHALRNSTLAHTALAGGAAATISHGAFDYMVEGQTYAKGAGAALALTGLGLVNTAALQFCKVRVEIDVAGTISAVQGPVAANQATAVYPGRTLDANGVTKATMGILEIPASFVFGTTLTNVAGFAAIPGDPDLGPNALQPIAL